MDYQPPALCIRSITPAQTPGRFLIDMPSRWTDDGALEVGQDTINYVTVHPFQLPQCPPGYPNPPQ